MNMLNCFNMDQTGPDKGLKKKTNSFSGQEEDYKPHQSLAEFVFITGLWAWAPLIIAVFSQHAGVVI